MAKAGASRERLAVGRIGEEISADRTIEETCCTVNDGAAVRIRGPCEAYAWRDVVVTGIHTSGRYARIARKQNALGESRRNRGLHSGNGVHGHELGIGWRGLDVVPDTKVDGKVGKHAPIVLSEKAVVEVVRIGIHRDILPHRIRATEHEVADSRAGA